jgi:RNA polymerase sigma-70 factor (ECF subfamily)
MSLESSAARTGACPPCPVEKSPRASVAKVEKAGAGKRHFETDLIQLLPSLRSFARFLCGNATLAEDLAQDACVNAIAHADSFELGGNMRAWMFTIVRNQYFSHLRKRRREVADPDGGFASVLSSPATQNDAIDLTDVLNAMKTLPRRQSETLMLVGPLGFSYSEAAARTGEAQGTIKSRAHRGRLRLAQHLQLPPPVSGAGREAACGQ